MMVDGINLDDFFDITDELSYEDRLDHVIHKVRTKSIAFWKSAPQKKKIAIIQLGRCLEKERLRFDDIRSIVCMTCGKARKIRPGRKNCHSCEHKRWRKK